MGLAKDPFTDSPIEPTLAQDLQSLSVRMQIVAGRMMSKKESADYYRGLELVGDANKVLMWAREIKI